MHEVTRQEGQCKGRESGPIRVYVRGALKFPPGEGGYDMCGGWESSRLRKGRLGVSKLSHGELYHDPDGRVTGVNPRF